MLLRDSVTARQVRTYLLDTEAESRPQPPHAPVDDSADTVAHSLLGGPPATPDDEPRVREIAEEAVREVMGTAVLPILNEAVRRDTELHFTRD